MEEEDQSIGELASNTIRIVLRRRWWIILPAVLVALATAGASFVLPNQYESEATLMVIQQRVSQRFVEPAIMNIAGAEAFNAMTSEILSRSQLLRIIDTFGLYPKERAKKVPREKLAARMLKDVQVAPQTVRQYGEVSSFKIAFRSADPRLANEVTNRLAALFVEENLRRRTGEAASTTRFLADQLETAKKRLTEQEQRVRDFKIRNLDQLPQQEQANLGAVTDLRIQLQSTVAGLSRAQQQKTALESSLSGHVARLQSEKEALLQRYTPKHPEVAKKDEELRKSEALLGRLRSGSASAPVVEASAVPDSAILAQLRGQVEGNLIEIENLTREEARARSEVGRYQGRLKLTPVREQELAEIFRDYELYKKDYSELLNKHLDAQLSATIEERQEGQQFRLVDPPTMPTTPSSPPRLKISLGGIAAGLVFGCLLAFLIEGRDGSFHSDKEIRRQYAVPMVVSVPLIFTAAEERTIRITRIFEWVAATALVLVLVVAEFCVYRFG